MSYPPRILKYCRICEKVTWFNYDRVIGHSRCEICYMHSGYRIEFIFHNQDKDFCKEIWDKIKNNNSVKKLKLEHPKQ